MQPRKDLREGRIQSVIDRVAGWSEALEAARAAGRAKIRKRLYDLRDEPGTAGVSATIALAKEYVHNEGIDPVAEKRAKQLEAEGEP